MAKKASMVRRSAVPVALVPPAPAPPLRLDLGCGTRKKDGFVGVDSRDFAGVDKVLDLAERIGPVGGPFKPWPWDDDSVEEIHCSHFVEHLDVKERVHFVNECHRIMKPGAKILIVVPHWSSCRAYGDLTHKWPPVSEFWFFYLSALWRAKEAPHNDGYTCDFDPTWGFGLREDMLTKNREQQEFAMANYKDVCLEIHCTLVKPIAKEHDPDGACKMAPLLDSDPPYCTGCRQQMPRRPR